MHTIRKLLKFESAHQLESAYSKLCSETIHGHSYKLELFLSSEKLNSDGMVMDFGELKSITKELVDGYLDHSIILPESFNETRPDYVRSMMENNKRLIMFQGNPTAEEMSKWIFETVNQDLVRLKGTSVMCTKVILWETETGYAEYTEG